MLLTIGNMKIFNFELPEVISILHTVVLVDNYVIGVDD